MFDAVPGALLSRSDVERCLGYIRELSASLSAEVRSLSPDVWAGPTNCPPWQVRDIVAHLVTSGDGFRQSVERGLAGTLAPPSSADRERRQEELVASAPSVVADALDAHVAPRQGATWWDPWIVRSSLAC